MKINNKGFMMVEVIITSTVVVTAMIGLYSSFNKIYNNYKLRNSYYDIDGVYATKNMVNSMINNDTNNINMVINSFQDESYEFIINSGTCLENLSSNCGTLKDFYGIENMIFVEYDKSTLESLINVQGMNQTFKDYIDYVIEYYGIGSDNDYSYIVLTELKVGEEDYYYSNLRMR